MRMKEIIKKILPDFIINFLRNIILKRNEKKQLKILNKIELNYKNTSHINYHNILSKLCEKYGSDKGFVNQSLDKPYNWTPHSYTSYYHSIFNLNRENIQFVFECGLGTNNPNIKSNMTKNGSPGASLRVWRDYFFNAKIYGGDIDKDILFQEDRIKTYFVDQLNSNSIKSMWEKIDTKFFDIIIDDGLHEPKANLNFFYNSYAKLKKNGVYIIEDVSNEHINNLFTELKNYDLEIVNLSNSYKKIYDNNNLIIIRNS